MVPRAHAREGRLITSALVSAEDESRGGYAARHLRCIVGGLGSIDHCPRVVVLLHLLLLLHRLVVLVVALKLHRVVVVERLSRRPLRLHRARGTLARRGRCARAACDRRAATRAAEAKLS